MAIKDPTFIIYRIFYDDQIVYVGRTKQPLTTRIHGHLFQKPMHRTVHIDQVSKIEYATLQTEADMNLYEIYYILKYHPPLNVDDKARDQLTVSLPELEWKLFETHLWDSWKERIHKDDDTIAQMQHEYNEFPEKMRVLRSRKRCGELTEDEFWNQYDAMKQRQEELRKMLYNRR